MFWKKATEKATAPSAPAPARAPTADEDQALDTIALFLRIYGETALAVAEESAAEIRTRCEEWAKRIVVGGDRATEERGALRRDWGGVRRFFSEQRKHETDHFRTALGDLREALHAFSRCVIETVSDDRAVDEGVRRGIERLSVAVGGGDPEDIKGAALATVEVVHHALAARKERQEGQLEALRAHVASLQEQLDEARQELEIDPLTQLFGESALQRHAERLCDLSLLLAAPPVLLRVRVDGFAALDADLGRAGSDVLLRELANRLQRCFLRREDFVARVGSDGFAVIVGEPTVEAAAALAERALEGARKDDIASSRGPVSVTVSVSVTALRVGESATDWIARADSALAAAQERTDALIVVDPVTGLDAWRSQSVRPAGARTSASVPARTSARPLATRSLPPRTSARPGR